jgi:general secretion pathway protein G
MRPPQSPQTSFRNARRAFTLLEILVVLAIIGMLVGLAVTSLGNAFENAKKDVAKTFVTTQMQTALGVYRIDMGDYPSTAEGIQALIAAPNNPNVNLWRGPYIQSSTVPLDPWKRPYLYAYPGTHTANTMSNTTTGYPASANGVGSSAPHYDVWSTGPSGVDGNADNIGSWMQ